MTGDSLCPCTQQLAVDVKGKLGITLQDDPAPDKGQVMPMTFLDHIGIPNTNTKIPLSIA
jgi:hypothetical protein